MKKIASCCSYWNPLVDYTLGFVSCLFTEDGEERWREREINCEIYEKMNSYQNLVAFKIVYTFFKGEWFAFLSLKIHFGQYVLKWEMNSIVISKLCLLGTHHGVQIYLLIRLMNFLMVCSAFPESDCDKKQPLICFLLVMVVSSFLGVFFDFSSKS